MWGESLGREFREGGREGGRQRLEGGGGREGEFLSARTCGHKLAATALLCKHLVESLQGSCRSNLWFGRGIKRLRCRAVEACGDLAHLHSHNSFYYAPPYTNTQTAVQHTTRRQIMWPLWSETLCLHRPAALPMREAARWLAQEQKS